MSDRKIKYTQNGEPRDSQSYISLGEPRWLAAVFEEGKLLTSV